MLGYALLKMTGLWDPVVCAWNSNAVWEEEWEGGFLVGGKVHCVSYPLLHLLLYVWEQILQQIKVRFKETTKKKNVTWHGEVGGSEGQIVFTGGRVTKGQALHINDTTESS